MFFLTHVYKKFTYTYIYIYSIMLEENRNGKEKERGEKREKEKRIEREGDMHDIKSRYVHQRLNICKTVAYTEITSYCVEK